MGVLVVQWNGFQTEPSENRHVDALLQGLMFCFLVVKRHSPGGGEAVLAPSCALAFLCFWAWHRPAGRVLVAWHRPAWQASFLGANWAPLFQTQWMDQGPLFR